MSQENMSSEQLREQKLQMAMEFFNRNAKNYLSIPSDERKSGRRNTYNVENLKRYIENPEQYSSELVSFSKHLYHASSSYQKVINFYATMPTYSYVIDSSKFVELEDENAIKTFKNNYIRIMEQVDKMSLRHELQKLMKIAWKEDVVYCYEMETKESYYIKHLEPENCRISSIEDGVFNYEFNFSIFEGGDSEKLLQAYPPEFTVIFNQYLRAKNNKNNRETVSPWIELDSKNAFAIKINEDITHAVPPFLSSMESALDEDMYKKIKANKDALDNFMALVQQIPINDDNQSIDNFRISLELAMNFHDQASQVLPDGIGLITSPMKIEAIKLEKSKRDDDLEMKAKDNTLSNAGLPPNIFSTTNKTAGGIKYAIHYLEQITFAPLRQIERWINRKLKRQTGKHKFQIRFLDVTNFSREEVFNRYLKGGQAAFPVKQEIASSLDMTPLDFYNKLQIENQVLDLTDLMIPLPSSHTQSNKEKEAGRERLDDKEVSESTENWRENRTDE